jgi:hypothetical protein
MAALRVNPSNDSAAPARVELAQGSPQRGAGGAHTCARHSDGSVGCWGFNGYGQIGDGTTTDRLTPTVVPNLAAVTGVVAGAFHTCSRHESTTGLGLSDGIRARAEPRSWSSMYAPVAHMIQPISPGRELHLFRFE